SGIGGVKRPGIVHRLDKDTSGLMIVAKTDKAHRALSNQFAGKNKGPPKRGYPALVWGAPDRPTGLVDAPIGRHPQAPHNHARPATSKPCARAAARLLPIGRYWSGFSDQTESLSRAFSNAT